MLEATAGPAGVRDESRHGRLPDERMADRRTCERIAAAKAITVAPLEDERDEVAGKTSPIPRSTKCRCFAKRARRRRSKCSVNGRVVMPELVCDGVLVATPGGIDRLQSLRPRPDPALGVQARGVDPDQPVPAAALARRAHPRRHSRSASRARSGEASGLGGRRPDRGARRREGRGLRRPERSLTLLFDPEHALDERIAMEQFAT